MKIKKLRSISEVLQLIKSIDPDTAVTRYMITSLIKNGKINSSISGNKVLVDYDEVFSALGLYYD